MAQLGALCFGIVMGWITYRTLRRNTDKVGLSDIATVLGAIGGAAVTALFADPDLFGVYAVGLAIGFFGYLLLAMKLEGENVSKWMNLQNEPPRRADSNEPPSD